MSEGIQPEVVLNEFGELSRKSRRELIAAGVDPDTAVIEHIRTASIPVVSDSKIAESLPPTTPPVAAPASLSFSQLIQGPQDSEAFAPAASVILPPVTVAPVVPVVPVVPAVPVAPAALVSAPFAQAQPVADVAVFSPSLSRRDMRNLRERSDTTSEIPVIFNRADDETYDSLPPVLRSEEIAVAPAPSEHVVETVVVIDDESVYLSESAPQTIAEVTVATAISDSITSRRRSRNFGEPGNDRREDSSEIQGGFEQFSISTMSTQSTGVIPTTGSALILPTLPEHSPGALASFSHTGEIYLTGSITLPSGIGQYGADFLSLDTSEIDVIAEEAEISPNQDLAPIRASSAVSAYSTSNTVVTVSSKFKDRLPLVLAITAAGLAVGVIALFITGYVLGVF